MSDDLLADLLQGSGVRRRVLDLRPLAPGRGLRFPCERSIGLHWVLRGPVHLHAPQLDQPLQLASGDLVLMARGCDHILSMEPALPGLAIEPISPAGAGGPVDDAASAVVSGAYQFWNTPLHPFFGEIPNWSVLRAGSLPRLGPIALATGLIEQEMQRVEPGRKIIVHGLLDVVFAYALREIASRCADSGAGWSQAARDPQVRRALSLLHEDCAHPWTLEELAQRAGLSRTALAERFREVMGDTPLNHLRTLRMQRAMQLLADTDQHLEAIAAAVGYQDAFGFSKVFKRTLGLSPKEFRQRDAAERDHPFRFQAG